MNELIQLRKNLRINEIAGIRPDDASAKLCLFVTSKPNVFPHQVVTCAGVAGQNLFESPVQLAIIPFR